MEVKSIARRTAAPAQSFGIISLCKHRLSPIRIVLSIIALLIVNLIYAESFSVWGYVESYPQSAKQIISAPPKWDREDWLLSIGLVSLGTGLFFLDEEIDRSLRQNQSDRLSNLSTVATGFGEKTYVFPALISVVGTGLVLKDEEISKLGLLSLKSAILASSATYTLKLATQRDRPSSNQGNGFWNDRDFDPERDSFPSGHASLVWAIAPILADQFAEQKWLVYGSYGLAISTSLSRIYLGKHWASDVFASAVIGIVCAKATLSSTPRIQFYPSLSADGIGLSVSF